MRKVFLVPILALVFTVLHGQLPPEDPHWRLVFEDSFDTLDRTFWKVAHEFDHYGEPQVYTDRKENVFVKEGLLHLRIANERYRCSDLRGGACNKTWYDYTSGWMETNPLLHTRYGYLESRIRIPHGHGFWPAFWTFVSDQDPDRKNAAEIDIFEMLGDRPKTVMGTNLHLAYCNCDENECDCEYLNDPMCPEVNPDILCHQMDIHIPDYSESFLTYGLEWSPSKIIWYVNGEMVRNEANPGIHDQVRIIFNLAISPWNLPDETTPFPSVMEVDYFRIYALERNLHSKYDALSEPEAAEMFIKDSCRLDGVMGDSLVLGGNVGISSIPEDTNVHLRATKSIEIRGGFSVPHGSQLYLDVNEIE